MNFEIKTYLGYVGREVVQPTVYFFAAIIGSAICFLTSHFTVIPFLVPLFVQIMVRSSVKFRQRHRDALVELPAQKEDPVFIMDTEGRIILSVGKTRALFEQYNVRNIKSFISEEAFKDVIASTAPCPACSPQGLVGVEVFSNMTLKWYEVKATVTGLAYGDKTPKVLVWFQDISLRKMYTLRLKDLLRYSDQINSCLENDASCGGTAFRHLAIFLLKEYEGVLISRADSSGNLNGYAFRVEAHKVVHSDPVLVSGASEDPVWLAHQSPGVVSDNLSDWDSEADFNRAYPFDSRVLAFVDRPVRNFIIHSRDDICITAFNFRSDISLHERDFFEVVGKIFGTMTLVADLQAKEYQRLDERGYPPEDL